MTNRNLSIILSLLLLAVGCTAEDATTPQKQAAPLAVTVTAGGFTSAEDGATRATDKQYTTTFASGDRIGIFAISDNGVVLDANAPYQYDGSAWTPVNTNNTIHQYHYAGVTYFVYYPYSEAMDNAANEADIISKFSPQTDQSTQAAYTASDLMTGTGAVENGTLKISLSHKMSLILIRPEGDKYVAGDYEYRSSYTAITSQSAGSVTAGYEAGDGMVRFLVSPGTSANVSITYTTAENATPSYNTTLTPTTGRYYRYNIATGGTGTHTPAIGDYYMANGSIVPKSRSLSESQKKNCLGVIFSLTTSDTDRSHGWTHGYVLAVREESFPNSTMKKCWSTTAQDEPFLTNCYNDNEKAKSNMEGYTETESLIAAYAGDNNYDVVQQILYYHAHNPRPANAPYSPWYVPSCGQWYNILTVLGEFDEKNWTEITRNGYGWGG
ncbi:MAG: fimbrillin family protein [Bacteroides sp.]|nr:fimbrillin family protein [Bacteroides sp.]